MHGLQVHKSIDTRIRGLEQHQIKLNQTLKCTGVSRSILVYAKKIDLTGKWRLRRLLLLLTTAKLQSLGLPTLPAGLGQVFTYHEVTNSHQTGHGQLESPLNPPGATEQAGDQEPATGTRESSSTAGENLFRGVVVEVDPASSDASSSQTQGEHNQESQEDGNVGVGAGGSFAVTEQQEEGEVDGEEGHELGVGRRHSIAFTEHLCSTCQLGSNGPTDVTPTLRSLLLNDSLQDKVQTLTGHLANKHQDHLDLSG